MTDNKPALPIATEATVWEKPSCPQCIGAKLGLKGQGIVPTIKSLIEDPATLAVFKANGFASAPILQFPSVIDGDEVLFAGKTVAGNQVHDIEAFGAAQRELEHRIADRENLDEPLLIAA